MPVPIKTDNNIECTGGLNTSLVTYFHPISLLSLPYGNSGAL